MRPLLAILFSACCFSRVATAAAEPSKKSSRTCRILFLAAPDNAPKTIFLSTGTTVQQVELPSMNLSDVYQLPEGMINLRMFTQPPAAGAPIPANAPTASVAEGVKDLYLLVASDPANPIAPLRMQVVDVNPGTFRPGQMLLFNLSPFQVGGQLGSQALDMKPNSRVITDAPASGFDDYPVKLGFMPAEGKPAEPICSTVWRHDPTARGVVFVVLLPNGRSPRIRGFVDARAEIAAN